MFSHTDRQWMQHALGLAQKAKASTSPNPKVGAVVVRQGQLISEGWHEGPGTPHAEAVALSRAAEQARGATLYVTLEPCCHWGRTAPCTQQIISSGVQRVVAAVTDPNPDVNGMGFQQLINAGIQVEIGLLRREAQLLNDAYFTWRSCHRPYVYAKIAQSLDGKVATRTGHSQWITSESARHDAHGLRARVDAIIVGVGTVLADDPRLTARRPDLAGRQPLRIICDSFGRTPPTARCFQQPGQTVIATTPNAPQEALDKLADAGATLWIDQEATKRPDLHRLLTHLAQEQITSIMVEGGPTLIGAFRDADLIDELHLYIAPFLIGGKDALSSVGGIGAELLLQVAPMIDRKWVPIDPDTKFVGRVRRDHLDFEGGS